jgi:hypothetical protein
MMIWDRSCSKNIPADASGSIVITTWRYLVEYQTEHIELKAFLERLTWL